ncbi:MAG: AlbA family DNA-binding domain-containing protein [Candidatus Dormibacteria bacterium]
MERVKDLLGQNLTEGRNFEYKGQFSSRLVETVAAMANTYGGIVLVGVDGARQLVGVSERTVDQIANACHDKLDPPWEPEIIPLPLATGADSFVLVLRVQAEGAPRPILIDGKAFIRLTGRNAPADRGQLARLFAEPNPETKWTTAILPPPQLPTGSDGAVSVDFIIRTGLIVPLGEAAVRRPLSERGIELLIAALKRSALRSVLFPWVRQFHDGSLQDFRRLGFNRARHARLVWELVINNSLPSPIDVVVVANIPDQYATPATFLQFTVDVTGRARKLPQGPEVSGAWRLGLSVLYPALDDLTATVTDPTVVAALADLAGIGSEVVPQPTSCHFLTGVPVTELLDLPGLVQIEGAGTSQGALLLADPALDLSKESERGTQVDSWLVQIALDSGLQGMEALLDQYHDMQKRSRRTQ